MDANDSSTETSDTGASASVTDLPSSSLTSASGGGGSGGGGRSSFPVELERSMHELRGALIGCISSIGGDARKPQQLARQLKLDKTLAWKIARVVNADVADEAFQYLPGDAGMELFLDAIEAAGSDRSTLSRAREVVDRFRQSVHHHVGDRPTLEIVLDALPSQKKDRLTQSRKLAFRGNSGIWGVQSKVRLQSVFVWPSATDAEKLDAAVVVGWLDFRRIRQDARWVLFRHSLYSKNAGRMAVQVEPLDEETSSSDPLRLLRKFCTGTLPSVTAREENEQTSYHLGESEVGNAGAFSVLMGSIYRSMGNRYASGSEESASFAAQISAPVENMVFDLFVHRDLRLGSDPKVSLFGALAPGGRFADSDRIPLNEPLRPLVSCGKSLVVETPLFGRYREVVELVTRRSGTSSDEFSGWRYSLEYPPFPSTAMVSFQLPTERRA